MISALFGGKYLRRNMKIRLLWIRIVSWWLGLKIQKSGEVTPGIYLFVSNHRSFIDPVVALHFIQALPLAKAEVNGYPLIGFGARMTGVLFVQREDVDSRRGARLSIRNTWKRGYSVLIYPEGTTFNTPLPGPFRKGSFEVAAEAGIPVIPIAIEFEDVQDHWKDRSLLSQYLYQFGKSSCRCKVAFGDPITEPKADVLHNLTKRWIDQKVSSFRKDWDGRQDNESL